MLSMNTTSMAGHTPARLRFAALLLVAIAGMTLYASDFYPGAMGFDSTYQWWQARSGETSNLHGVAMTWLWRLAGYFAPGPSPLFLLQLLMFWGGLVLIGTALYKRLVARMGFMILAAGGPICLVLFSFVANDVMFMSVLSLALGILLHSTKNRKPLLLSVALMLIFLALLLRKNALPAILPLVIYVLFLIQSDSGCRKALLRSTVLAIPIVLVMQAGGLLLDRTADRRVTIFAGTALWDLAAVSISANEILLPPGSHGDGLTVDDLRNAFEPYANTTIFERTHAGMRQPFLDPSDPLNEDIWRAWVGAILAHPGDYLAHRWRLTLILFGSKPREWPRELVYFAGEPPYRDNPRVEPNTSHAHEWLMGAFEELRSTIILAAWPYVALALLAFAIAWRRRGEQQAQAALAVLSSGLLYALPLPLIAPSAELRYLGWTCLSSILGAALIFSAPKARRRLSVATLREKSHWPTVRPRIWDALRPKWADLRR
jgi:hypothetical protein